MKREKLIRIVVVVASGTLALPGCAADAAPAPAPAEESPGTTADELKAGAGGGGLSFSCSRLGCICHGDADCNDMFEGGACGDMPAKCYERGPGPVYCICAPWVGKAAGKGGRITAPGGGGVLRR